ncbi:MAG: hypothetical protein GX572_04380 [Clostridia bacterium]|nr:hypothetical protein [Clostridia bacterium]
MSISYDLGRVVGHDGAAGLDGTTFIPALSAVGDLSWSNADGKANPATVNIMGPQGETGHGLVILGIYATPAALAAACPSPQPGAVYAVGGAAPYDIYIWDSEGLAWRNFGVLQGPPGEKGDSGASGQPGPNEVGTDTDSAISGLIKGAAGKLAQAVAGTDYQAAITASGLLKGAGSGSVGAAAAGTDYQAAITASGLLKGAGSGSVGAAAAGIDYQAAITASGLLKGAGSGSVGAAAAGTDYQAPTQDLPAGSALVDADTLPVYQTASAAHRKITWSNILAAIGTAIIGVAGKAASLDGDSKIIPAQSSAKIIAVTGNKTLALADAGTLQQFTGTSDHTLTVPKNDAVDFPLGTEIEVVRYNTGNVTIAAAAGVTINKNGDTLTVKDQYTSVYLKKMDANQWLLQGNLG